MAEHIAGALNWERLGKQGLPLVFVHPNPMDHSCWVYQMARFSTWFRCIGVDLPGYGRSPRATPGLTMPDVALACWEAVDEVTRDPAILVGLSVGTNVVLHMASQQPGRSLAILVSGASYRPVKEFAFKRAAQYRELGVGFRRQHALEDFSPAFRNTSMGQYFADLFAERNPWADAATIVEMFLALGQPDPDWLHAGVKVPMLIITGSEDNSHEAAFALQRKVQGCELITIQGAGHACNMEQPWLWDAHALRFLKKHGLFEGHSLPE
ncbi:MAG: alpha/beta hydrolase [Chloroflexi bacterium]|nr:alpha/beta hydrolase [Chloroflexota bacterium]